MKGGKRLIIIGSVVIGVLLIAIIVLLAVLLGGRQQPAAAETPPPKRSVLVSEENVDEVVESIISKPSVPIPRSYNAKMNSEWHFPDGKSVSPDAYVENSKMNKTAVWFDVVVDDTGETIYESPVLPVDTYLREIKLDKDLDAGTYNCTLTYHLVDDDQNELTTLSLGISIVVAS